jgi:hypothetical protein
MKEQNKEPVDSYTVVVVMGGFFFWGIWRGRSPYSKFIKQKPNPIRDREAKTKQKKQKNWLQKEKKEETSRRKTGWVVVVGGFLKDGYFFFLLDTRRWEPKWKRFSMRIRRGSDMAAKRVAAKGEGTCPLQYSLIYSGRGAIFPC